MAQGIAALVPAAGQGERLGLGPKAFLVLDGGPTLLEYVVGVLQPHVDRILVGVPYELLERARTLLRDSAEVIAGGTSRQETLRLLYTHSTEDLLVIHDVTRPFASGVLVESVIAAARTKGAAACFTQPHIPVARVRGGMVVESLGREDLRLPQSPQAYRREILAAAYAHAEKLGIETQTTWQLACMMGAQVVAVPGEESNIKITTPLDWEWAQKVIWPALRKGTGDVNEH